MSLQDKVEDREYLLRRMREERAAAANADDDAAAHAHSKMADEYERRAHALVSRPSAASSFRSSTG